MPGHDLGKTGASCHTFYIVIIIVQEKIYSSLNTYWRFDWYFNHKIRSIVTGFSEKYIFNIIQIYAYTVVA